MPGTNETPEHVPEVQDIGTYIRLPILEEPTKINRPNIHVSVRSFALVGGTFALFQSTLWILVCVYIIKSYETRENYDSSHPYWKDFLDVIEDSKWMMYIIVSYLVISFFWFCSCSFMLAKFLTPKRTRNDAVTFSQAVASWTAITILVSLMDVLFGGFLITSAIKCLKVYISREYDHCFGRYLLKKALVLLGSAGVALRFVLPWLVNVLCAFVLCMASFQSAYTLKI